ncbi:hypothetical protein MMC26_006399 [Xylographa opegraphella]|nr:hypothetical protein [Xylographa opegraphella]
MSFSISIHTPPTTVRPSRTGTLYVSQPMSADAAMGLAAAMKNGRARVKAETPHRPSSRASTLVATVPQTPSSLPAVWSPAETIPPPTRRTPAYSLIDLAMANDPALRAKIDALPVVSRAPLAVKAQAATAAPPSGLKGGLQEELRYAEAMRLVGQDDRKALDKARKSNGIGSYNDLHSLVLDAVVDVPDLFFYRCLVEIFN